MRVQDITRRAAKNLRQAKGRTLLTSLAIGVGAFTIALAMAAGNGGRAYLDNMVSVMGSVRNINIYAKQDTQQTKTDDTPKKLGESQQTSQGSMTMLTPADMKKIRSIDGVEAAYATFSPDVYSLSANNSDEYEGKMEAQVDDSAIDLSAGKLGDNYEIKEGQIVLPHKYVTAFGFKNAEDALGKTVKATFVAADQTKFTKEFTIVAVDKQPSSPLGFYYDQFRISNKDGELIQKLQLPADTPEQYYGAMVRVKKDADINAVKQSILAAGNYEAQTFAEMRSSVMQVMNIVQYGLMGFGLLAIIASVFGIINTQYISVLERTQQIGLMKALGARRKDVAKLFRYEAAWIGFFGGVIGVGLAFLVTLFNPIIASALTLEPGTQLLKMDWLSCAVLILALMAVAILSGYFPARKAAKLDPIEALRTE